jgi:hypothetical protein
MTGQPLGGPTMGVRPASTTRLASTAVPGGSHSYEKRKI